MSPRDTATSSRVTISQHTKETRRSIRYRLKKGFIAFGANNLSEVVNISKTGIKHLT